MSFLEVYNEKIIDLLNDEKMPLEILEDKVLGTKISNLTEIYVSSQ